MAEKAAQWRAHQAAWRASGLSVAAYCRRHGLAYAQWMYWQRRLAAVAALVPIRVEAATSPLPRALSLEVSLPGGTILRVAGATAGDVVAVARGLC